jgi:LCP family protein required for cell wall assembly
MNELTELRTEPSEEPFSPQPRRRRREGRKQRSRGRRALRWALIGLVVVILAVAGGAWWMVNHVSSSIERIPGAFDIPEDQRPPAAEDGSLNLLLAGLDGEDSADDFERGAARTDAIMVVHLDPGRDRGYLISIPRDTWVPIPGEDENKINAAYSLGGPSLYVQTVEQLTGLRMDHLAVIDWSGFRALTDALGGVQLTFDQEVVTADDTVYEPGTHTLSGEEALQYVRERKGLPGGDFDRVKRQQNYLRALMNELLSSDTMSDPGKLLDVTGSIGEAARVDDGLSATDMVGLGMSLRDLRSDNVTFLTVPTNGTGTVGSASIVVYDKENADLLWTAVREDNVEPFLAEHADLVTGESVQ